MFSKHMFIMFVLSACTLTGCGGGDRISAPRNAVQNSPASASPTSSGREDTGVDVSPVRELGSPTSDLTRKVGGTRRGIQSIFFLALEPSFANSICDKLNSATDSTVEIEFSAAHDTRNGAHQGWMNAQSAINRITAKNLNLVVDFGNKTVAGDQTPSQWGVELFNSLFKANRNNKKLNFVVEVANEDNYSLTAWTSNMRQILGGLRGAWQRDGETKSSAFPYDRITVRHCSPIDVKAPFKIDDKDKDSFSTETEYHFPMDQPETWNSGANAVSNDGQVVYRANVDPNPWALDKQDKALRQVTLSDFKSHYTNRARLLWHPAMHRWYFKDGAYHYPKTPAEYADADTTRKNQFLALLTEFLK